MHKTSIPFLPAPLSILMKISRPFVGIGAMIAAIFPSLENELRQTEIGLDSKEYGAIMFVLFVFYFAAFALLSYVFAVKLAPEWALIISPAGGLAFSLLMVLQLAMFPKIKFMKKVRGLERNLIFALRTILVEVKSGVSLFDALKMVANGNYGEISEEFKKTVEEIETGTVEEIALEEMAKNNPSIFLRRAIWQIVNGLKAGGDISNVMGSLVDSLAIEQRNQIRRYGGALRFLSLMYLMLGVIIPALGLTFLIILSTFPQIQITEIVFWALFIFVLLGQFMYLGLIKSKRPNLMGE